VKRSTKERSHRKRVKYLADSEGCRIRINGGTPFFALVSFPQRTDSLEMGGFATSSNITATWPIGKSPEPQKGASLLLVEENESYLVEFAVSNKGDISNPVIVVNAVRSSR
jgi:hypothetical protein